MCALLDQGKVKGGCWDASAFAEEAKGILEDWLRGLLTDREALEAIFQAARENNFSPDLEEES
ncbi:hypothetical protein QT17_05585 [Thermus sp. 2.9]|nr:hypothetical protein QT17_05585 [Thermus sp. 2.9]